MTWAATHVRSVAVEDGVRDSDWTERAACKGADSETFFPVGTSGPALDQAAAAKAVCARCPVTAECLAWSVLTRSEFGVFGGLDEEERRSENRRRAAARKSVSA